MSLLVDATLGLTLMTVGIVNASMTDVRTSENAMATMTGQYMSGLQAGVNKYIATNGDVISGRATGSIVTPNGVAMTVVNPAQPTMTELMNGGFLPVGYTLQNPSKLTFSVAINPTNCPGVGCQLPATIQSSQYKDNQGNIRNDLLATAVAASGLDGGQSLVSDPTHFTSSGKTWSMANTNGVPGQLIMRAGSLTTGYVDTLPFYKIDGSRALTGTMNANGNNISNAGQIATATLKASGNVTSGSLNTGAVTASTVALPAGNSLTIAGTQWYGDGTNAAVRVQSGGALYIQTTNGAGYATVNAGNANFTGNTTTSGNSTVQGQAYANTMVANGITSNGNINAGAQISGNTVVANGITSWGNIAANGQISGNTMVANGITSNGDLYTAGNQTVNGVLTARNLVNLPALAYDGWGCSGNAVTTDPAGHILSCQSGVWHMATTNNYYTNNYPTTYVYQQPTGKYVTDVTSGPACGGYTVHYSDGSAAPIMSWAGCSNSGGGG